MQDIPQYKNFTKVEPVNKGWSSDKKYYAEMKNGEKLLIRLTDISEFDKKKAEYEAICTVSKQEIPMSQPVDFGICNDGKSVYMILTWIDGKDAQEVLPKLSAKEQYNLGINAGRLLRKIHSVPAHITQEAWETRFNRKIDRNIEGYYKCGIKINGDEKILSYIEQNRYLLKDRPQTFQHGDYHVGNILVLSAGELSVIDFNRFDYGDPFEEFNRIIWCADCSKYFATGRINGYFDNNVPHDFFKLLALYISSNILSSIYWAIPFGQAEINTMTNQAQRVLEYYEGMINPTPKWYVEEML